MVSTTAKLKKRTINFGAYFSMRLSIKDQMFFAKRLAFLIKAGVPILESFHMLREQTRSHKFGLMLDKVIFDVSNGQYLSTSIGKHKMFGDLAVNVISVGESSGILAGNLEYLAEELKKRELLRRKIVGAFVYPVVVAFATLGITGFLMVYLFPKIMPIFQSLNFELPLSTRIVIWISEFLRFHGITLIFSLILLFIALFVIIKKYKKAHFALDSTVLNLPLIGNILRYYNLANATRTMGLLLNSGMTLGEALPITARTSKNLVYRKEFGKMVEVVNRGEKISTYLKIHRNVFPEIMHQIISVGERSGNLAGSLIYLSELYEGEVDDFTKNLSSLIEPILMVAMGLIVGLVAVSIISPIYGITQHLQPK